MNVAEQLRAAAAHIEWAGFTKGNYFKNGPHWRQPHPDQPCCTMGALWVVTGEDFGDGPAAQYFAKYLGVPDIDHIPAWNDKKTQRKDRVVKKLRAAAAQWEKENASV